jgi:hypothetical protein
VKSPDLCPRAIAHWATAGSPGAARRCQYAAGVLDVISLGYRQEVCAAAGETGKAPGRFRNTEDNDLSS